jgi:hypothetical protein
MDNVDSQALEKICGDMDDMESEKMFKKEPEGTPKGVSINIEVTPKVEEKDEQEPEELNQGGMVDDEMKLPPFLRKKK